MILRLRRNSLRLPRLALLVALALGMTAQSLVGVAADLHESVLHAVAGETYAHHHAAGEHAHGNTSVEDESPTGLHLLQHQSCGGHCAWIAGSSLRMSFHGVVSARLPLALTQPPPSNDYTAPFRPPIQV